MDIILTDSMLREYLETNATPLKIAECLSLCGPSIEKVTNVNGETVYQIEVTGNRVDTASTLGIATEAAAILPRFGFKAKMKKIENVLPKVNKKLKLNIKIDENFCQRFVAVKIDNITVHDSPKFIKDALTAIGQRPLNNVIDITNYVMFMTGVPLHAFDADLLGENIIIREARRGEKFTTLDQKEHVCTGGEIVFDNGKGEIVDLPGIMGTFNTSIKKNTKNIVLVSEHMDPLRIRKASLTHETRTFAATLNEKDPDPSNLIEGVRFATALLVTHTKGNVASDFFDWYKNQRKETAITITKEKIDKLLGVNISLDEVAEILTLLDFKVKKYKEKIDITIPTKRVKDVTMVEDIVEEIARIYGYFNLPSNLPQTAIPEEKRDPTFTFENKLRNILSGFGGVEIYTLSMVSKEISTPDSLKIINPLGEDGEYMRTQLTPSLLLAAKDNPQEKDSFHLFEISNVYIKNTTKKSNLPDEVMTLAGVFSNCNFRQAKGVIEALFKILGITSIPVELKLNQNFLTYEYTVKDLMNASVPYKKFQEVSKFPPQIEDLNIELDGKRKIIEVIDTIKDSSEYVVKVDLVDIYENKYTFRIYYQDKTKTLTDLDVTQIRETILKNLKG